MDKIVKRGYMLTDDKEFGTEAMQILYKAGQDLFYLLNKGYKMKGASVFVGNHYLLSERQRLALTRAISSEQCIEIRKRKEINEIPIKSTVNIDGFNTIITLEIALSDSLLIKCMDGTIRDLAGLRGTYRLIDKTQMAILLIGKILESNEILRAVFYLDSPVSNSGKLKQRILELLADFDFEVHVETISNVDSILENLDNVVTSDAIILDRCRSWINLNKMIIESYQKDYPFIDFSSLLK